MIGKALLISVCAAAIAISFAMPGCGKDCDSDRQDAIDLKDQASQCNDGDTCQIVQGMPQDCTGELTCPWAARIDKRSDAEQQARGIALTAQNSCKNSCTQPSCVGTSPVCDTATHHCVLK